MRVITTFLNELTCRIDNIRSQINDFDSKQNVILLIKNILFKYNADKKPLAADDLIQMKSEDFLAILKIMDEKDYTNRLSLFESNMKVVDLFKSATVDINQLLESPQYNMAIKFFDCMASEINDFIDKFQNRNNERIESLKASLIIPNKYLTYFQVSGLIKPIVKLHDLEEINNLLDTLGLSDDEKAEIKLLIGKSNYQLQPNFKNKKEEPVKNGVSNQGNSVDIPDLQSYRELLKELVEETKNIDLALSQFDVSFEKFNIMSEKIANEKKLKINLVEKAIIAYLIKMQLTALDDSNTNEDSISQALIELQKLHKKAIEILISDSDQELIEEIITIIKLENNVIDSADQGVLNQYILQNFDAEEDEKTIKYKIIAMLLALQGKLEEFQQSLKDYVLNKVENEYAHSQKVGEIKEIISSYKILKNKLASLDSEKIQTVQNGQKKQ